ncbi:MAG: heat-inducible transcription repressor HrcA [Candidatus Krumholzibacteriota bacterium]|nr:heat-inducible transcription repressor HrcA [Candidatus Krumholzibacteriota bacterium]
MAPVVLTTYELELLKQTVDLYIETGRPVSSRMLRDVYGLGVSTAKIRKSLYELERKGFLLKPHVSAGRVPSDTGYRLYVDGLDRYAPLTRKVIAEIRRRIGQDCCDVKDVLTRTSVLLGDLTSYMGIILGIFPHGNVVEHLRIVQLDGPGGLVLLRLAPDRERRLFVRFSKRHSPWVIERAAQMINERIAGCSLDTAARRIADLLRDSAGADREIAGVLFARSDELFDQAFDLTYSFKGLERPEHPPELHDPQILRTLVRLMGERRFMIDLMRNRLAHEVMVTIGHENGQDGLDDFSVVTRRFRTGEFDGLIGVLGPTRMSYAHVLALLDRLRGELHRLA